MTVPVKFRKGTPNFIPFMAREFDLDKCLELKLGASVLKEAESDYTETKVEIEGKEETLKMPIADRDCKFSVMGACLSSMKKMYGEGTIFIPRNIKHSSASTDIFWRLGPSKVNKVLEKEEGATLEELNLMRLDFIKLLLDNKLIELETESKRAKAMELGILEAPSLDFEVV